MLREAYTIYHDLLTDELARESQGYLEQQQQAHGLYFGDRPLCSVLRPRFLSPELYSYLQQRGGLILQAFDKAYRAAMTNPAILDQFGLYDWEKDLILRDSRYPNPSPLGRLDSFFVSDTLELKFIEYNAETPAAPAYNDVLTEIFYTLPAMRRFLRHYQMLPIPARHDVLAVLLDTYHAWGGREEPHIAILDWREVPTYSEFVLFRDYFQSRGVQTIIADPHEVEYRDGKLMCGDFHINIIYKRILVTELVERCGPGSDIVRAVLDHAVCMVNPFQAKLLYKKASLAVLSDERNMHLFTPEEVQAIDQHIPWTRRIEDRQTLYMGQVVDLLPFAAEHKDILALKSNDEYGGKGVVLGWTVSPDEWAQALLAALHSDEVWVVQKRATLPTSPYPRLVDGRLHFVDHIVDTDPFTFYGSFIDGCLTRISTQDLLNVTAGTGSTVPSVLVSKR